jgi:RHS repeat-associated protein
MPCVLGENGLGCPAGAQYNVYFGGKLVKSKGVVVVTDRLGSVRANMNGETMSYFPYGEERTSTADGREKFGTYTRDNAATDYADQRYYGVGNGRFFTPDPAAASAADSGDPGTWNMYTYAGNDPINLSDPTGLIQCGDLAAQGGGTLRSAVNAHSDSGLLTRFVWAEGGTLAANGGSETVLQNEQQLIALAIENRLGIANGQIAVLGSDGTVYWGNGGNGPSSVSVLGYGTQGTTLAQELVRAAAGTSELTSRGELADRSGLDDSLNTELGDPTRPLAGRVPVTMTDGSTDYVTPECERVISAWQATNAVLGGVVGPGRNLVTSWKQAGHGNTNPDSDHLVDLGQYGATEFYGFTAYQMAPYPYVGRPRPRPRPR